MANQAAHADGKQPKVDVLLTWCDFLHALEVLRNKPYSQKSHQRDWFRLNPLDIVLLGSETVKSKQQECRKISHTYVGMGDISSEIFRKPRILEHILLGFKKVLQYSDASSPVVQRCCTALGALYEASLQSSKLRGICVHCYLDDIFPILEKILDSAHVTGNPTTRVKVRWLVDIIQKLKNKATESKGDGPKLSRDWQSHPFRKIQKIFLSELNEISIPVACQVVLLNEDNQNLTLANKFCDIVASSESFSQILIQLKDGDVEFNNGVRILLHILQVVFGELVLYDEPPAVTDVKVVEGGQAENNSVAASTIAVDELINTFVLLLNKVEKHLAQWNSGSPGKGSVPSKILELVFVGLSSRRLEHSLPSMLEFLGDPLSLLMIYASEGYLTEDSTSLLLELLDLICCAIEVDFELQEVVTNFIPNLFGPVFGIHDGHVLCKVLEFGKLALKSRHRKKLLWDGITCILKVYKLFEPIQIERSKEQALIRKVEAVSVVLNILDDVIEHCIGLSASGDIGRNEDTDEGAITIVHKRVDYQENSALETNYLPPCTTDDVLRDRKLRVEILLHLLELANALTASGNDILYIFASVLPRVFSRVPPGQRIGDENIRRFIAVEREPTVKGFIPWNVDRRSFAVKLLALSVDAERNGACSAFQLCAVVLPKLVKNLSTVEFSEDQKLELIEDIFKITHDTLRAGHDIDVLVSHGIALMCQLLPAHSSADELRDFMQRMAKRLTKPSFTSVILLLSTACDFMMTNFPEDTLMIQRLFLHLLQRGKRDDIRNIARLCNKALCETRFEFVRSYLYLHATGELTSRQLAELSEIVVSINTLTNKKPSSMCVQEGDGSSDEVLVRRRIILGLTNTLIEKLRIMLVHNELNKAAWTELHDGVTKVSVCVSLLTSEELSSESNKESFDLDVLLRRKFPIDVIRDRRLMAEIGTISKRIQFMQQPRYDGLKQIVVRSLNEFLTANCSSGELSATEECSLANSEERVSKNQISGQQKILGELALAKQENEEREDDEFLRRRTPVRTSSGDQVAQSESQASQNDVNDCSNEKYQDSSLSDQLIPRKDGGERTTREEYLGEYLLDLPRNKESRERLAKSGYSKRLWLERPTVKVSTSGTRCVEENLRENLVACFAGYEDLLKELGIPRVEVDGAMIEVDDLFDPTVSSVAELKGRRAVAARLIDKYISRHNDLQFLDRKNVLLATENAIEAKFEEEARKPCKPITFTASINTSFFDCARCCGSQIIGCYAPNGNHCERPLEIGIRQDSGFASIYDEAGTEIENCELLFTDQGAYVFRAYTNSHPYDTSQVWIKLFTTLLNGSSPYVPAVIVPHLHPSVTTWNSLRRHVPTEITGSILTCDLDFSVEWQTYYDYRPECVRGGKDIVLKRGFDISQSEKNSMFLQRQLSLENKDLGGLIFEQVMNELCEDDFLKRFRFLGTHLCQYIGNFLEDGYGTPGILSERFDYERWLLNSKQTTSPEVPSKDEIVHRLSKHVQDTMTSFLAGIDFEETFANKRHQFFQMKAFFQAKKRSGHENAAKSIHEMNSVLRKHCRMTSIHKLEQSFQEEIIHWIFRNEDRVWRFRGGRDGYETLEQFMSFLGKGKQACEKSFPGVVVYVPKNRRVLSPSARPFEIRDIVAYTVGEYGWNKTKREEEDEDENDDEEDILEELAEIEKKAYEVVTTWVHPRYRRLSLGIGMYMEICRHIHTQFMICDILENSLENIISSSSLFALLGRVGLLSWFVGHRRRSYQVITQNGEEEQFERIVIRRNMLGIVIRLHDGWFWVNRRVSQTAAFVGLTAAFVSVASYYYLK